MIRAQHWLVIGDVAGPGNYHVGDEAMLAANVEQLRRRFPGCAVTVVSRDPSWTSRLLGVESIAPVGFAGLGTDDAKLKAALLEVLNHAEAYRLTGTLEGDFGREAILEIERADGLFISGGGNLNSTWPEHIFERLALARLANAFSKPVVITGQTLGPHFAPGDFRLIGLLLQQAQLVGVRELPSLFHALLLGVKPERLLHQVDDAFYLDSETADFSVLPEEPWIAVTLHPSLDPATDGDKVTGLARQFDRLAEATKARLVFLPHVNTEEGSDPQGDLAFGEELVRRSQRPEHWRLMPVGAADEVRAWTGQASMVVSSRYHPLVFGLAAGVGGLGLFVDDYTKVKLQGALGHAGLERLALPMETATSGRLCEAAMEVWNVRQTLSDHLGRQQRRWRHMEARRWERICQCLLPDAAVVDRAA